MERKTVWNSYTAQDQQQLQQISDGYRTFLDNGKTERECVSQIIAMAQAAGYRDLAELIKSGEQLSAGAKVYTVCMKKAIALFHLGSAPLEQGMAILGAHIDSPRLDIKQNPLYEDTELVYLDTHYYGGVKKYQWVTIPLAIHGVVAKKDGSVVEINIGDHEDDPIFCITDLLIHLAAEQQEKKGSKLINGEDLDLLIGSMPLADTEKDAVKANIIQILADQYSIDEEDFLSAELEIVPAGRARECGIDRSMIMAYGHDDRVCAYASLLAMLESETRDKTICCLLMDKEEIGSVGATGTQSRFFENAVAELMNAAGQYNELALRRCLCASKMLSSDVSAGYDPLYASVYEKKNTAYLGKGIVFNKYTGSRGKSGSNDANAEYFANIRSIMDNNNIGFQTAELGKVDIGGGGTIAYILALYGMDVVDCGVAVLNMHAPWEIISKADLYEAKKGYSAFIREA